MFENYIRVNLHPQAKDAGYPVPKFVDKLIDYCIEKFANEYQVSFSNAYRYHYAIRENLPRLEKLLRDNGIKVELYGTEESSLESYGILLDPTDPTVVEFKLKYGS